MRDKSSCCVIGNRKRNDDKKKSDFVGTIVNKCFSDTVDPRLSPDIESIVQRVRIDEVNNTTSPRHLMGSFGSETTNSKCRLI